MKINDKETQLLYLQIYIFTIFIMSIIVSIILTYNNIQKRTKNKKYFSVQEEKEITIINRLIITGLVIAFTYVSYEYYKINKQKNRNPIPKEELFASILTLIAGLILLYTTFKSNNNQSNNASGQIL